jgi:hypothetical protein
MSRAMTVSVTDQASPNTSIPVYQEVAPPACPSVINSWSRFAAPTTTVNVKFGPSTGQKFRFVYEREY